MNPLLLSVIAGAARPIKTLPGEYAVQFVRALYDETANALEAMPYQRFQLIRNSMNCAIEASAGKHHDRADAWLALSHRVLELQSGQAWILSFSCLKTAEAYLRFARGQFAQAHACIDAAWEADARLPVTEYPAARAQRLHYRHLTARTQLGEGKAAQAVGTLVAALKEARDVADTGYQNPDLLSYACSRIAGELAIACGVAGMDRKVYIEATEPLTHVALEGSVSEYLRYRDAWITLVRDDATAPMADLLNDGRMKTVCWYVAVCDIAPHLNASERKDLATISSGWRDMPKQLWDRLLQAAMA
jgi:hypothetical protein